VLPFFLCGGAGSPSNAKSSVPRHTSIPSGILIHPAVWPQRTRTKNWGVPLFGGRASSPRNTLPTCMPGFILIHPTVWPQYTSLALSYWQHYCTALAQWARAKLCGTEHRAPPIFGRVTITLGIGPHSSYGIIPKECFRLDN